jgi:hypothetical protein
MMPLYLLNYIIEICFFNLANKDQAVQSQRLTVRVKLNNRQWYRVFAERRNQTSLYLLPETHRVFTMRGVSTVTRGSLFSADDRTSQPYKPTAKESCDYVVRQRPCITTMKFFIGSFYGHRYYYHHSFGRKTGVT